MVCIVIDDVVLIQQSLDRTSRLGDNLGRCRTGFLFPVCSRLRTLTQVARSRW